MLSSNRFTMHRPGVRSIAVLLVIGALLAIMLSTSGVMAQNDPLNDTPRTYTVNSTADINDAGQGDGICSTGTEIEPGVPECTLRAAISEANFNEVEDTIIVPEGTYLITLTGASDGDFNQSGDFDISNDVIIQGAGAGLTIIDGGRQVTQVIDVGGSAANFAITLTMTNLTVKGNGAAPTSAPYAGTVYVKDNQVGNRLILEDVTISESRGNGLVIDRWGIADLTRVNISNNERGGISNFGTLNLTDSVVVDNIGFSGLFNGSVTYNTVAYHGDATIINTRFENNDSGSAGGGAIATSSNATTSIQSSLIIRNRASYGGGIFVGRDMDISKTTIAANIATESGGGIFANDSTASTALNIIDSTISENQALGEVGGTISRGGGGLFNQATNVYMTNVTFSNNFAQQAGGAIFHRGLIRDPDQPNQDPSVTQLNNVTITNNLANFGGGYYARADGPRYVRVANSIIAGNEARISGSDCRDVNGARTTDEGHNLIGDTDTCPGFAQSELDPADRNNLLDASPSVNPLAANGGETCTHELQETSIAIDAANIDTCAATDQRGGDRGGVACDMGSYERSATNVVANSSLQCEYGNASPDAIDDSYSTPFEIPLEVAAPGVLANDTDDDPTDTLTAILETAPAQGNIVLRDDGSFTYTPADGEWGEVNVTYRASDGTLQSNVATIRITVESPLPVANNDFYSVGSGETLTINAPGVLGNDTDPTNDTLTATKETDPTNGTLTLNTDGSFNYEPNAGFEGEDSFSYFAEDAIGSSNIAIVTIVVSDNAPIAREDTYSTQVNEELSITAPGVLDNDTDPNNDELTAAKVTDPANGSVTLNADGSFVYTPDTDFEGEDSFTYQATDGTNTSNIVTVTIIVSAAAADTPVARSDSYTTAPGETLSVAAPGILTNDSDPNDDPLTAVKVTDPTEGNLTLESSGAFIYIPPNDTFTGQVTFTYQATDGTNSSNLATVVIEVTDQDPGAPSASNDTYNVLPGGTLNVSAPGVLANDTDPDGDSLTAVKQSDPSNGTLTLNDDGSFTYVPNSGFTGADTFNYTASDGTNSSNLATVTINVQQGDPDELAAFDDNYTTNVGENLVVVAPGLLSNDTGLGTLTAIKKSDPSSGVVAVDSNGGFTYIPNSGFTGTDTFTYAASDGTEESNVATVTIQVIDPDTPVANDDSYTAPADTVLDISAPGVLANDTPNDGTLTAAIATNASNGAVTLNADGSFTYTPDTGFTGQDTFTYTANKSGVASQPATVTINVSATAPRASNDTYTVDQGATLTEAAPGVLANDTDPNGDTLTAVLNTTTANGSLALNADGSFTYTPDANFTGTDTFTYTAQNTGGEDSNLATVTITVNPSNTEPLTLLAPTGTLNDSGGNPLYRWVHDPNIFGYEIYVHFQGNPSAQVAYTIVTAADYCTGSICEVDITTLPGGGGYWLTRNAGYSVWLKDQNAPTAPTSWRGPFDFQIQVPQATLATLGEVEELTGTSRPVFNWTIGETEAAASWFFVSVSGNGVNQGQWIPRRDICGGNTGTECSTRSPVDLVNGTYNLYVFSWSPGGMSMGGVNGAAGPASFTVNAAVATAPSNFQVVEPGGTPTLTWSHTQGNAWYQVWIGVVNPTYTGYVAWIFAEDLGCSTGTCTLSPDMMSEIGIEYPPLDLYDAQAVNYEWYVRAWGPARQTTAWTPGPVFSAP